MKYLPNALRALVKIVVLARILQIYPITLVLAFLYSQESTAKSPRNAVHHLAKTEQLVQIRLI